MNPLMLRTETIIPLKAPPPLLLELLLAPHDPSLCPEPGGGAVPPLPPLQITHSLNPVVVPPPPVAHVCVLACVPPMCARVCS